MQARSRRGRPWHSYRWAQRDLRWCRGLFRDPERKAQGQRAKHRRILELFAAAKFARPNEQVWRVDWGWVHADAERARVAVLEVPTRWAASFVQWMLGNVGEASPRVARKDRSKIRAARRHRRRDA